MAIAHIALVLDAGGLSGSEKLVLLAYCNHTDAYGYTWAGVPRIADETGVSERTVQRTNDLLRSRGLLKSAERFNPKTGRQITSLTRVNLDLLASMKRPPRDYADDLITEITFDETEAANLQVIEGCQSDTPRGDNLSPSPRQSDTPRGVNLSPKSSVDPSGESSSHPQGQRPSAEQQLLDLDATEEEMTRVLDRIKSENPNIRSLSAYVARMAQTGDLAVELAKVRAAAAAAKAKERPAWCGECDEVTRWLDADGDHPRRCPRCNAAGNTQTLHIHGQRGKPEQVNPWSVVA